MIESTSSCTVPDKMETASVGAAVSGGVKERSPRPPVVSKYSDVLVPDKMVTASSGAAVSGGVKERSPRPPVVSKRAHSAAPLSQPARNLSAGRKSSRRCASLSPVVFGKKSDSNITFGSSVPPSSNYPDMCNICPQPSTISGASSHEKIPHCVVVKMQRILATKKREFVKLRKNLIQQQKTFLALYSSVRELETRMTRIGQPVNENFGDVRILSVTSWPAHDLLLLVRDDIDFPAHSEIDGILGPQILQQLHAQLIPVPGEVLNMGMEIMARRNDVLQVMRAKPRSDRLYVTNLEWKSKNAELDQETERLQKMLAGTAENLKAKMNYALELAKIPWMDRDSLIKKLERLQKDNLTLQHKVEEALSLKTSNPVITNKDVKTSESPPDGSTLQQNYQALQDDLNKERAAREALKNVVTAAETMLRVARSRITTLERQLKETKAEVEAAHRKHKDLDQLYRQREASYDVKRKKLLEASKTGKITVETLTRQRDALELRVKELRERVELVEKSAECREAEQRLKADSLAVTVAEQEKAIISSRSRVAELEAKVKELEEIIHNLREHSSRLVDMERSRCLDYIPSKENEPSDRETEIWQELQETRMALSHVEEELRQSRADKDNFLNSLSKIAQGDGADNVREQIATELLEKEQKIIKLQQIIEEQRENEKLMEQSMTQYENQLANLRLEVKKMRNYHCYTKDESYQELQTELLEMHIQVEALTRERTALVTAAASRALMLERHERAAELFARVTRARRDLAALLEDRSEPPSTSDVPFSEISRSLSLVCMSSQETWTALRAERARVLRLESAVLAQSLQLEREGRVRTQLERRRALLEREVLRAHCSNHQDSAKNVIIKNPSVVQDLLSYK